MKHFIWMLCGIFLAGLMLGSLSACGADQFATVPIITTGKPDGASSTAPEEGPAEDQTPAEGSTPAEDSTPPEDNAPVKDGGASAAAPVSPEDAARYAYGRVLWGAYQNGVLPDGSALDYTGTEAAAENQFALCDVDGDGQEELILLWNNAIMAGMTCRVFGCRGGEVYEELAAFPSLTFYDNGTVEADWSHNQGLGGRIWPIHSYRYDADSGVYENIGGMDAWDGSVRETDFDGNPFPSEIDADGDLLVYFLLPANWDGQYDMGLVDGPDFNNWRDAYIDGAEPITLPTKKLTEENIILATDYPKPDAPVPEPAG